MSHKRPAFSLVELLVVIGIIALLIAMLIPALTKARAQALTLQCQSNMHQIGQQMVIYANSNRGSMFPPENGLDVPADQRWYIYVLHPTPPINPADPPDEREWTPPALLCPADDPEPVYFHSYIVNHPLYEHHIVYSSRLPAGVTSDRAVVMGEKKTELTNYYVEIKSGRTTYFDQVEIYRHGVQLASNYLYLDLHVDKNGPIETPPGGAQDPWDFSDNN